MNYVFLGPPGSGKGTQAQNLTQKENLQHISTGDLFRDAISSESALGVQIKGFVNSGKLVPDELVSALVFEHLKKIDQSRGFLLDGYPRTLDQAKALDGYLSTEKISLDAFVFFEVDPQALIKRLSNRRQCESCKEVYNLETKIPEVEGKCDKCGSSIIKRKDDEEDVIQERLLIYNRQTAPILEHYQGRKGFLKLNANQPIDNVFQELVQGVQSSGAQE